MWPVINSSALIGWNILSSLNAVNSTNERNQIYNSHMVYNLQDSKSIICSDGCVKCIKFEKVHLKIIDNYFKMPKLESNELLLLSKLSKSWLKNGFCKVKTLWEGHKIWKKSPTCFDKTDVFTQYRQNKWEIFSSFVAFSEKLDFKWVQNKILFLTSK